MTIIFVAFYLLLGYINADPEKFSKKTLDLNDLNIYT